MPDTSRPFELELRRELRKIYLKTFALRLAAGLVSFVALGAWIVLGLVVWTALTREPALWHTLTVVRAAAIVLALLFMVLVLVPLARMPRFSRLANQIENGKDFKDILTSGYEFSERGDVESRYSPTLVREVIRRAVQSVAGLQVRFLFLTRKQLQFVPLAYAALVVLTIVALASPDTVLRTIERATAPHEASAIVHEANLHASPGDVTVLAGNDVEVSAVDFGGTKVPVTVSYNLAEGFWKTEPTNGGKVFVEGARPMRRYTYRFNDIRNSLSYYFSSGDRKSPVYHINVVHKPIVTELSVVLTPPAYTGEAPDTLVDSGGNVQALEGTDVAVRARSNNVLSNAWVDFEGKRRDVEFSGREFSFDFRALEDGTYAILLEDDLHHKTDEPLVYSVEVYKDNPPILDVLEPGEDAALPRNMRVDVSFIASDDYGVEKASIFFRKGGEQRYRGQSIPLEGDRGTRELAKSFTFDLSEITLFPGNYVEYFLQVEDNNVVTGPGVTKSRVFQISVPTMAELYEKIEEDDAKRADLFDEAKQESKELKERMEKLSREFKKTEQLDWSQKKEVDKAIASQEAIQEKIDEIQRSLEETMQSLSDNEMTSQEIGDKLEEIQKLIEQINDEALNKYVEELRKAMEKLNPDEIQQALENLDLSAEEFLKSLERTENLLKEIQREQDMEELVRNAKDLMDKQEDLTERTTEADADDSQQMNDLAKEQSELADKSQEMEQELDKMSDKLSDEAETADEQELADEMNETAEEFSESQASEKMRDASSKMKMGEQSAAKQKQEQAMDDLIALFSRVMDMQMSMQTMSQNRTAENLQRLAHSTLELSFRQEKLTARLREQVSGDNVQDVRALAEEQLSYVTAVRQIANELDELAKREVAIPRSLLQVIGETMQDMNNSMLFLEQNKAFMSTASASRAITNLNVATIQLLSACQACQQGSGTGQSTQTRLQQLLSGQRQMMQQSQEMLQMRAAQEKMLQERQAMMQRLAGKQRSLQELAEEMQHDGKGGERTLGRMDKIVEEMEEVIRDLAGGVLDEQTMRKQQRILSRLLDANRSVHSRDYEKKRLSLTADDVFSDNAGSDRDKTTSQQLREEIRRAMSLKAPGEFEDLIRLYFRALAEEAPQGTGSGE